MGNYTYNLTCRDGGSGWGDTGQKGYFIIDGSKTRAEADLIVKDYIPGGWESHFMGMSSAKPGLRTTGGHFSGTYQ